MLVAGLNIAMDLTMIFWPSCFDGDPLVATEAGFKRIDEVRTVTALRLEKLESPIPVYNLDVEDFNSYFVESGLLVHNVSCKSGWKDSPDTPINKQLQGTGQISPLRTNPNMMGVDVDALLQETPKAIEQLAKKGKITARVLKAIKKAFEGRKFKRK